MSLSHTDETRVYLSCRFGGREPNIAHNDVFGELVVCDLAGAEAVEPNECVVSLMMKTQIGPFGIDEQRDVPADLPAESLHVERAADVV